MEETIHVKIRDGIELATDLSVLVVDGWGSKNQDDPYAIEMHWATLKATCRRNGEFGDKNWNAHLAEPIYGYVSPNWNKFFVSELPKHLEQFGNGYKDLVQEAISAIERDVTTTFNGLQLEDINGFSAMKETVTTFVKMNTKREIENINSILQQKQRILSRTISSRIKDYMTPTYERAYKGNII